MCAELLSLLPADSAPVARGKVSDRIGGPDNRLKAGEGHKFVSATVTNGNLNEGPQPELAFITTGRPTR